MSTNKTVRPGAQVQSLHEFVRDACYSDSNKLYKLANIVKLAAFASEARRTLEGIDDALTYHKDAKETIHQNVQGCRTWAEMEDVTGDVLQEVARRLESLSEAISERTFHLDGHVGGTV